MTSIFYKLIETKLRKSINESRLSNFELRKYDWRRELFVSKLQNKDSFTTVTGDQVVLVSSPELIQYVNNFNFPRGYKIPIEGGGTVTLSMLQKTAEFGGGKGSGGGSKMTSITESAQCMYLQAKWDDSNTDYSQDALNNAYTKIYVETSVQSMLSINEKWTQSCKMIADALYKKYSGKKFEFHRDSSFVERIKKTFKKLNNSEKQFSNINKWSPADIWLVDPSAVSQYNIEECTDISSLNSMLQKAYELNHIIGVSLKQVDGTVRLKDVNDGSPVSLPSFTSKSYGKKDFFNSKDGHLFFDEKGKIQFRTFPAFQAEIKGRVTSHGKVGLGVINSFLREMGLSQATPIKSIQNGLVKDRDLWLDKMYQLYLKTNVGNISKTEFIEKLNNRNDNWLASKYIVMEIFTTIEGREQEFLEYVLLYARSETKHSCIHLKVY